MERDRTKAYWNLRNKKAELKRYQRHEAQIVKKLGRKIYEQNISGYQRMIAEMEAKWEAVK